jgi:hypothetical protein
MNSESALYRTTEAIWFFIIAACIFVYCWFVADTWKMWKQLSGRPQPEGVIVAMTSEAVPIKSCSELILVLGEERIRTGYRSCNGPIQHRQVGYTVERGPLQVVGPDGNLQRPAWLNWRLNALFMIPIAVFFVPIIMMGRKEAERFAALR